MNRLVFFRAFVETPEGLNTAVGELFLPAKDLERAESVALGDLAGWDLVFPDARVESRLSV